MRRYLLTFAFLAMMGVPAQSACNFKPSSIQNGFLNGTDLSVLTNQEMNNYVVGFVNGFLMAPLLGIDDACVREITTKCIVNRTNFQLSAILRKWLQDNPREWHNSANNLTYRALIGACMFPS